MAKDCEDLPGVLFRTTIKMAENSREDVPALYY